MASTRVREFARQRYFAHLNRLKELETLLPEQRRKIVDERVVELNQTEWQRWVPLVGFGRMLVDLVKGDDVLLKEIRTNCYNVANISYNVVATIGIGAGLLNYINK